MEAVKYIVELICKIFRWWIVIQPWEKGLRVRLGKKIKLLNQGIYFRIPFLDATYVQTYRLRVVSMPMQTLTSKDGKTISIISVVGYQISDIEKLYTTIYHPEQTIANIVMSKIAQYILSQNAADLTHQKITESVTATINSDDYGIKYEYVRIMGFAIVKTLRLLQDQHWIQNNLSMDEMK